MKKFFNFIFSWPFWLNILGMILFFAAAAFALMYGLRSCTRHGEAVTVPTVVGMDAKGAIAMLEKEDFLYEIIDSIYIDSLPKGVVVEQTPARESLVKHGRTVYMKINSYNDRFIKMPKFLDEQYNVLDSKLNHAKLKKGNVRWTGKKGSNGEVNIVVKQMYNGRSIEEGEEIKQWSKIDFVIAGPDPNSKEEPEEEDAEEENESEDSQENDDAPEESSPEDFNN